MAILAARRDWPERTKRLSTRVGNLNNLCTSSAWTAAGPSPRGDDCSPGPWKQGRLPPILKILSGRPHPTEPKLVITGPQAIDASRRHTREGVPHSGKGETWQPTLGPCRGCLPATGFLYLRQGSSGFVPGAKQLSATLSAFKHTILLHQISRNSKVYCKARVFCIARADDAETHQPTRSGWAIP